MSGSGRGGEKNVEPNLTPILDMVFQLITFFMLVLNFKAAELDLNLQLPLLTSAKPLPPETTRNLKLLVLNVEMATKCPVEGCDALATLHRVVNEDTGKVTGYQLVCERGHRTPKDNEPPYSLASDPHGIFSKGKTCLSLYGRLLAKQERGRDTPSIEEYLKSEADLSLMAAGLTRDDVVHGAKELPDIVVIRADTNCPYRAVYYVVTKCQEQGYRKFALKTSHRDKN